MAAFFGASDGYDESEYKEANKLSKPGKGKADAASPAGRSPAHRQRQRLPPRRYDEADPDLPRKTTNTTT